MRGNHESFFLSKQCLGKENLLFMKRENLLNIKPSD